MAFSDFPTSNFIFGRNFPSIAFGNEPNENSGTNNINTRPDGYKIYAEVGEIILTWAEDETSWPTSVAKFRQQLRAIDENTAPGANPDALMFIPSIYKAIIITQASDYVPHQDGDTNPVPPSSTPYYGHTRTLRGSTNDGLEFTLRLSPRGQVRESRSRAGDYALPAIYDFLIQDSAPDTTVNPLDRFHARVADYTMRGCR